MLEIAREGVVAAPRQRARPRAFPPVSSPTGKEGARAPRPCHGLPWLEPWITKRCHYTLQGKAIALSRGRNDTLLPIKRIKMMLLLGIVMATVFDEKTFEREAIKILDQVFQPYSYRRINYKLEGDVEYDAFYDSDLISHCIEITVSSRKDKAVHDIGKLDKIVNFYSKEFSGRKPVRGWFITLDPLTHEQLEVLKRYRSSIQHMDYTELRSKIIDSNAFLNSRENHPFGSFEPLKDSNENVIYIDAPFKRSLGKKKSVDHSQVYNWIRTGAKKHFIVLGDFGSGKSTFLKAIYESPSQGSPSI
ncbi:MAG: hypothetical protein Q8K28_06420 [Hoeflea sp.]|uniref:hypothetical protein n=1 Tax=Hoeflea sp. TaxID=1940281 RepID=UPI00272FA950|nr:hypothetical protein [Hoeflea sp.]MDP2119522.1 hypothetical protein [Hoeflea sp.]